MGRRFSHGGVCALGRRRLFAVAKSRAPRSYTRLVDDIVTALSEQSVTVPGARAAELVLPQSAVALAALLKDRAEAARQIEEMLDAHPLSPVLTSMPGVGVRTAARILLEVGDGSAFATPGTWPPMPAWHQSPDARAPRSAGSTPVAAATNN